MSGHSPSVLIGITTHNRADILPKAISSALAQDHPDFAVSVLDDGSTDETSGLSGKFPGVKWQRNEVPQGIIEARNRLMATEADYYVSLDDDAWFLRHDEIGLAVAHMEAHREVAAVAFDILSPDRSEPVRRGEPKDVGMFIGCGHVLRISSVREAGFYAATPGTYGSEEADLSLRLQDLDYRVVLLPGVHVWHDKAWSGRDFFPIHRSGVCNDLVMTLRRCPFPDLVVLLPLKFVNYLRFWLRRPSFFFAGLAGFADAARNVPMAIRTRRAVRRATFWKARIGGFTK